MRFCSERKTTELITESRKLFGSIGRNVLWRPDAVSERKVACARRPWKPIQSRRPQQPATVCVYDVAEDPGRHASQETGVGMIATTRRTQPEQTVRWAKASVRTSEDAQAVAQGNNLEEHVSPRGHG